MKIGIIVYSQTNNTYSVAEKLGDELKRSGHEVKIDRIVTEGEVKPGDKNIKFKSKPDVREYDGLVFCSPVHAFSLPPAMNEYLKGISSLKGKDSACFVTKNLPFKWTGGTRTVKSMKKIVESKGGSISGSGIIVWRGAGKNPKREKSINDLVNEINGYFSGK